MESLAVNNGSPPQRTIDRIRRVFIHSLHLNVSEQEFSYEDQLDEAVGLDSVAVLDFIAALEKEFGIEFEPEMLTIEVVRDLAQLSGYVDEQIDRRRRRSAGTV